jgi:transposase
MRLYSGFDLHSNNTYIGIIDENGKKLMKRKVDNNPHLILNAINPYKEDIVGIVIESTFNWYWLVDILMDEGYRVHLANPSAIQQYKGLKHTNDVSDAFWLAEMLRLGILPEGYIYPKGVRPIRDLLRKRGHLVRLRTSLMLSLQGIICRNYGIKVSSKDLKRLREDRITPLMTENEDLRLAGLVSKESIDFLSNKIRQIEHVVEAKVKLTAPYNYLQTLPGVGKILALTIMLETGPINRFKKVGNYASYCRKVTSKWSSNGKSKGCGNKKNGNKYLAWAYSEAAEFSRRFSEEARAFYNRKMRKTNRMAAHNALAHKLARAGYHVMKDETPFIPEKLFAC